jgi:hypothetical protein
MDDAWITINCKISPYKLVRIIYLDIMSDENIGKKENPSLKDSIESPLLLN